MRVTIHGVRDRIRKLCVAVFLLLCVKKRLRLFVNGENLTNVRQTQYDPLLRPTRNVDGQWTVDAWAPLDGRNINAGIRVKF